MKSIQDTGELKFTNQNDANRYAAAQACILVG